MKEQERQELQRIEEALESLEKEAERSLSTPFYHESVKESKWIQNIFESLVHMDEGSKALTPEEKKGFFFYLREELSGVHSSAVMICKDDECPTKDSCPLYLAKKAPKGNKCPIETAVAWDAVKKYADELLVGDKEFVDQTLITRLAAYDVYERRIQKIMEAKNPGLVDESASGDYDDDGKPITFKHIAHEWAVKDMIAGRREKLLKALVGTRFERYRRDVALKKRETGDSATLAAKSREHYDNLVLDVREGKFSEEE